MAADNSICILVGACQHSAGAKKAGEDQAIERSREVEKIDGEACDWTAAADGRGLGAVGRPSLNPSRAKHHATCVGLVNEHPPPAPWL